MSWRMTPEERRIINQTKREGEELYASESPAQKKKEVWKSALTWVVMIVCFVLLAVLIYYIGTLLK